MSETKNSVISILAQNYKKRFRSSSQSEANTDTDAILYASMYTDRMDDAYTYILTSCSAIPLLIYFIALFVFDSKTIGSTPVINIIAGYNIIAVVGSTFFAVVVSTFFLVLYCYRYHVKYSSAKSILFEAYKQSSSQFSYHSLEDFIKQNNAPKLTYREAFKNRMDAEFNKEWSGIFDMAVKNNGFSD